MQNKTTRPIAQIQVVKHVYYNEYGKPADKPTYYIRFKRKWRWRWVKHTECGWGDCYSTRTGFKTEEDAVQFISDVLVPGRPYDTDEETVISTI